MYDDLSGPKIKQWNAKATRHFYAFFIDMGLRTAVLTGKTVEEFEPMGDGTLCTVTAGTVLPPSDIFPIKNYAGEQQCKTWGGKIACPAPCTPS